MFHLYFWIKCRSKICCYKLALISLHKFCGAAILCPIYIAHNRCVSSCLALSCPRSCHILQHCLRHIRKKHATCVAHWRLERLHPSGAIGVGDILGTQIGRWDVLQPLTWWKQFHFIMKLSSLHGDILCIMWQIWLLVELCGYWLATICH